MTKINITNYLRVYQEFQLIEFQVMKIHLQYSYYCFFFVF